jgi:hypothetical protein
MKCVRLFTNENSESDFGEVEIPWEVSGPEQFAFVRTPSSMLLNETVSGHQYDWHNAPRRQWVITLQGEIEVQLRNGSTKRFGPGSILLAEDVKGTGHATKVVSREAWRCVYLPFEGELKIS